MTVVKILPVWSLKPKKLGRSRDFFLQQIRDQAGVENETQETGMLFLQGDLPACRDLTRSESSHWAKIELGSKEEAVQAIEKHLN